MKNQNQSKDMNTVFDEKAATSYDKRTQTWAAGRESLHDIMRLILVDLPAQARLLCVGVGTGLEVVALAQANPEWHFTLVDPAKAMLDVCRQKMEENGLTERCAFHEGYLDSLPTSEPFDAATCLLVSQFLMDPQERSGFFRQIAKRLNPQGLLISADLSSDMSSEAYQNLLEVFLRMMRSPAMSPETIQQWKSAYGRDVAVLPAKEIEAIINAGGFENPVLFFQNLLIHAWFSRRAAVLD